MGETIYRISEVMYKMSEYSDLTPIHQAIIRAAATRAAHSDTTGIVDNDAHFVIDTITRKIIKNCQKTKLVRGDHNSERLTFECPRYIEGHDMLNCNKISINYSKTYTPYEVDDLCEGDAETVVFTWLIKENVTHEVGSVNFSILFQCIQEDGEITYQFGTDINTDLEVIDTINSGSEIAQKNIDILEQMQGDIDNKVASVNGITPDENGNVEIEIPEGFSGSWNDLSDKPFGDNELIEVTLSSSDDLVLGQTYTVVFDDGNTYTCVGKHDIYNMGAFDYQDAVYIGNHSLRSLDYSEDTKEPFLFICVDGYGLYESIYSDNNKHSYSIRTMANGTKQLDEKFLPESIARVSDIPKVGKVVQNDWNENDETNEAYIKNRPFYTRDDTTPITIFNIETEEFVPMQVGTDILYSTVVKNINISSLQLDCSYTVVWDGVTYSNLTSYKMNETVVVGAQFLGVSGMTIDFSVYPFLIGIFANELQCMTNSELDSHDIRIDELVPSVVQIPEKYIPEGYINQLIEAKLSGFGGTTATSERMYIKLWNEDDFKVEYPDVEVDIDPSTNTYSPTIGDKTFSYCGLYVNDELRYTGGIYGASSYYILVFYGLGDDYSKIENGEWLSGSYVDIEYVNNSQAGRVLSPLDSAAVKGVMTLSSGVEYHATMVVYPSPSVASSIPRLEVMIVDKSLSELGRI